jgi:hypothetical protein
MKPHVTASFPYGIRPGQRYRSLLGGNPLLVLGIDHFAQRDEVLVRDAVSGRNFRIDALKLAVTRYSPEESPA